VIVIRTLDGTDLRTDENAVILVAGAGGPGTHTMVHGVDRSAVVTAEDGAALAARLGVNPPLAKLTRPDLQPIWVRGAAVTALRAPLAREKQSPGVVNAVVILGALHQAVHEDIATAAQMLNAHGANV
jgi:hypothetical protein